MFLLADPAVVDPWQLFWETLREVLKTGSFL